MSVLKILLAICMTSVSCAALSSDEHVNVKIGFVANLTESEVGQSLLNGVRLGVIDGDQFNAKIDGLPARFRLYVADDRGNKDEAKKLAQKMVDDDVIATIGHLSSGVSQAVADVYKAGNVIQINPTATSEQLSASASKTRFRIIPSDSILGYKSGVYSANESKSKRVLILAENNQYSKKIAAAVEAGVAASGGEVAGTVNFSENEVEALNNFVEIKRLSFDSVVFVGLGGGSEIYAKKITSFNPDVTLVFIDGLCTDLVANESMNGGRYICARNGKAIEQLRLWPAFIERYTKQFGEYPTVYSAYGYDAAKVIISAVSITGSMNSDVLSKYIRQSYIMGITGEIGFDEKGDLVNGDASFYEAKNGGWIFLE